MRWLGRVEKDKTKLSRICTTCWESRCCKWLQWRATTSMRNLEGGCRLQQGFPSSSRCLSAVSCCRGCKSLKLANLHSKAARWRRKAIRQYQCRCRFHLESVVMYIAQRCAAATDARSNLLALAQSMRQHCISTKWALKAKSCSQVSYSPDM